MAKNFRTNNHTVVLTNESNLGVPQPLEMACEFYLLDTGTMFGARFKVFASKTITLRFRDPQNNVLASKASVVLPSAGEYEVLFDTPYQVTQTDLAQQGQATALNAFFMGVFDETTPPGSTVSRDAGASGSLTNSAFPRPQMYTSGDAIVMRSISDGFGASGSAPFSNVGSAISVSPIFESNFTETDPPTFALQEPPNHARNIDPDTDVSVDVVDTGAGVDESTVIIQLDDAVAWQNDAAQTGYSVVKSPISGGFNYLITPD
ncbi:MAG: hypothetical protein ACYTEQ_21965, partial [Planctomycetota bacterium]